MRQKNLFLSFLSFFPSRLVSLSILFFIFWCLLMPFDSFCLFFFQFQWLVYYLCVWCPPPMMLDHMMFDYAKIVQWLGPAISGQWCWGVARAGGNVVLGLNLGSLAMQSMNLQITQLSLPTFLISAFQISFCFNAI